MKSEKLKNKKNGIHDFSVEYFNAIYEPKSSPERFAVLQTNYELLKNFCIGGKLLDVACALGEFAQVAARDFEVFGVDISEYAIEKAQKTVPTGRFYVANAEKDQLAYDDRFFDVVTAFDLVEHIQNTNFFFSQVSRVLKPGGIFFITTPAQSLFGKLLGTVIPDDPTHINKHSANYWISQLDEHGFELKMGKGVVFYGFPPFIPLRKLFQKFHFQVTRKPVFSDIKQLWVTSYLIFEKKDL